MSCVTVDYFVAHHTAVQFCQSCLFFFLFFVPKEVASIILFVPAAKEKSAEEFRSQTEEIKRERDQVRPLLFCTTSCPSVLNRRLASVSPSCILPFPQPHSLLKGCFNIIHIFLPKKQKQS